MQAKYGTSNFQMATLKQVNVILNCFYLIQYLQNITWTHNQDIKSITKPFCIFALTPPSPVSILHT